MNKYSEIEDLVDKCNQLILICDPTDKVKYIFHKDLFGDWKVYRNDKLDKCFDVDYLQWFIKSYQSLFENRKGFLEKYEIR